MCDEASALLRAVALKPADISGIKKKKGISERQK
jgi:hypothetical protein